MARIRDAKTGTYISPEKAVTMDSSTWVKEKDKASRLKKSEREAILFSLYTAIEGQSKEIENFDDPRGLFVPLAEVQRLFRDAGLKIKDSE